MCNMNHDDDAARHQPLKRRRITRACDRCHRGGIRCASGPNSSICSPCADFGSECTYNRPMKRRGPPAKAREGVLPSAPSTERWSLPSDMWIYREIATHEQIATLVDAYYSIVYPIFPIFHWPTFTANIKRRIYMTYPAFHAVTMSVCAIVSARLRDGASSSPQGRAPTSNPLDPPAPTSEAFYQAAIESFPRDLTRATDFDFKRAKPLLATLAIQYGDIPNVHAHIGDYMTLCAIDGFHNEARWPSDLNEYEVQERRRLFWLAYQLDVYTATTWGGIIRHRESQSTVLYPAEVYSDDDITPSGILKNLNPPHAVSFFRGWNASVDLYRILEHAVSRLRTRNQTSDTGNQIAALFSERPIGSSAEVSPAHLLAVVEKLYLSLPSELRGIREMTGDVEKDRYGFQAANVLVIMQTVKMVVAGMADWSVEQRCSIAGELLEAFAKVPRAYVQATSTPLLHHLAGVGHLLASIIHSPLSPAAYMHVRTVLLSMADLLSSLESSLTSTTGIAPKLREHVERIDKYMASAAEGGKNLGQTASPINSIREGKMKDRHRSVALNDKVVSSERTMFCRRGNSGTSENGSSAANLSTQRTADAVPYSDLLPRTQSAVSSQNVPNAGMSQNFLTGLMDLPFGGVDVGTRANGLAMRDSLRRREPPVVTGPSGDAPLSYFHKSLSSQSTSLQPTRSVQSHPQPEVDAAPFDWNLLKSPEGQQEPAYQLPNDLFVDWPFLFNEYGFQGDAFDFLSCNVGATEGGGEVQGGSGGGGTLDPVSYPVSGADTHAGAVRNGGLSGAGLNGFELAVPLKDYWKKENTA